MNFIEHNGYLWPESDRHAWRAIFREVRDSEKALKYVQKFDYAVQAGGNCGVWANYLRKQFNEVYSIEPDWENYLCLIKNTHDVKTIWAALGEKHDFVGLDKDPANIGAHQVKQGGHIPVVTIDDLDLPACDLIALDIEGMEPFALKGASKTIEKFKPVLMLEDKGLSERYGLPKGWSETIEDYEIVERIHRDVVLCPK